MYKLKLLFLLSIMFISITPLKSTSAGIVRPESVGGLSWLIDNASQENLESVFQWVEWRQFVSSNICNEDVAILERIVEAEATGGTIAQKVNVASCVINRVISKRWPNSVSDVVFQKHQFAPISDGRYYSVLITDSSKAAVEYVLNNGVVHYGDYFCTPTCKSAQAGGFHHSLKYLFFDGEHNYYSGGD